MKSELEPLHVDGRVARVLAPQVTASNELLDVKRKLEKRTTDFLWKERESAGFLTELKKCQKDFKTTSTDLQATKEHNEQLRQSLASARATIASQNAELKEVEDSLHLSEKLKKTEASLSVATRKTRSLEAEIKSLRDKPPPPTEEEVRRLTALLKRSALSEDILKTDVTTLQLKTETAQLKNKQFEFEIEDLRKRMENSRNLKVIHAEELDGKQVLIIEKSKMISSLKDENEQMKSSLLVRTESNTILQRKLDDMTIKYLTLERDEKRNYTRLEVEYNQLRESTNEMASTYHELEAKQKILEEERIELKTSLDAATINLATNSHNANESTENGAADKSEIKTLRNEVLRLKNESQDLKLQLHQSKDAPLMKERELLYLHQTAATAVRERQHGAEAIATEKKLRRTAEESSRALHLRVTYLLEQLQQVADLKTTWVEQKSVLKAEVQALHRANKLLRRQNLSPQSRSECRSECRSDGRSAPTSASDLAAFACNPTSSTAQFSALKCLESTMDYEPDLKDYSGDTFEVEPPLTIQNKAERSIEKAMFDIVCAFSSGSSSSTSRRKKPTNAEIGAYEVRQSDNGLCDIVYNDKNIDGDELLNTLQISQFLKLCHNQMQIQSQSYSNSRKDTSLLPIFAEKIALILSFHRHTVQEMHQQLSAARMENTALISRTSNFKSRVHTAKVMYTKERVLKQTAIMKTVREQMRLSDILLVIDDVSKKASDKGKSKEGDLDPLMQQMAAIAGELSAATISSGSVTGPKGAMELSLCDCGIDDETLIGVMSILKDPTSTAAPAPYPGTGPSFNSLESSSALFMKASSHSLITASATLAKSILSGGDYMSRILLLNLKGNCLTDISCKTLSVLVEHSLDLRMLDLRDNSITPEGVLTLMSAVTRNPSVLQANQKKARSEVTTAPKDSDRVGDNLMVMIEGVREVAKRPSTATPDAESSVAPKHPLRIDLRHNNPERGTRIAEDLLECSLYSTRMSSLEGDLSYEKAQLFRKTPGTARVEYESRPSTAGSTGPKRLIRRTLHSARSHGGSFRNLHFESGVEESVLEEDGEDRFAEVSNSKGRGQSDGSKTERGTIRDRDRDRPLSVLEDAGKRSAAAHAINKTVVLKRPFTADPSLSSQSARAAAAAIGSMRDKDRDSSSANVMEIHQGSDSSLSPLRNRSFRAKEESISELFPAVESERKALSVLDPPKMTRQELHSDSVSPGGYFEKRKTLSKVMKAGPRTKPRSAVPSSRKQYLGSSSDHSKSAQFDLKKCADDVRPGSLQRDLSSTFHGSVSSIVDEASSSKESKESDTPDALLPNVTSSSVKDADSTVNEIHQ